MRLVRAAFVLWLLLLVSPASGQLRPVVIEENRNIRARLSAVEEQFQNGLNADAVESLLQIVEASGDDLVRASPNLVITVRSYAHRVLAEAGPQALAVYRTEVDSQPNQWFERATADPMSETRLLEQIVHEAPQSSVGAKAMNRLGEIAWRSGQPGLAYEYWRRLLPLGEVQTNVKLVLCRLAMDQHIEAARLLKQIPDDQLSKPGQLAGRSGSWRQLLQAEFNSDAWKRDRSEGSLISFHKLWSRQLSKPFTRSPDGRTPSTFDNRSLLFRSPAYGRGLLFVSDCASVQAFDLNTGLNPWTSEPDTEVFRAFERAPQMVPEVPLARPCLVDGRLVVRVGSVETSRGRRAGRVDAVGSNSLICLDVQRRQGKLLWKLDASDVVAEASFESDPIVLNAKCFVVMRTALPKNSLHLVCVSLEDGIVLWNQQLCGGLDEPVETKTLTTSVRPVVTPSHVIVPTQNGALIATNHSGEIQWARTYDRVPPVTCEFPGETAFANHGVLYVAPRDSEEVFAIREHTGEQLWKRRLPDRIAHVAGAENGTLVVSGRGPWGLNSVTGTVIWGGPRVFPEHFGLGRGVLFNGVFLFPTRSQIEVRSLQSGAAVRAPILVRGANLDAADGYISLVADDRLALWSLR